MSNRASGYFQNKIIYQFLLKSQSFSSFFLFLFFTSVSESIHCFAFCRVFKAVLSSPRVAKPTSKCAAAWWSPPCVWASSALPSPWWEWSAPRSAARRPPKPDWPPCQASTSFSAVNKPDVLLNPLGFVFFPPSLCMVQFTLALIKAQLVEFKGIHWGAMQRKKFKVCFQYSKDKVLKQRFNLLIRALCACGALNVDQLRGFCHLTPTSQLV